jgi:multiple sugar transport system ATP-binding protein
LSLDGGEGIAYSGPTVRPGRNESLPDIGAHESATSRSGAGIRLRSVSKVYPNGVKAVDAIDLDIKAGEFVVLVGPSGCGKTTLLRMIAGLEQLTDGTVEIGEVDVTHLQPRSRDIAMVFQNYALYPQMTVFQNLAFGLKLRRTPRADRKERVHDAARMLGLEPLLDRRPALLSGGQRQRVAMGRAMVREPKAFLMDEPLSNLDAKLRVSLRGELSRLHKRLGVTTVYVTHDQVEAMTLGHRVAVLRDGLLQQCDTPHNLFHHPTNLFVAAFIGSPSMNLVEATVANGAVRFGSWSVPLPPGSPLAGSTRSVIVGLRPTDFEHADTADPKLPQYTVEPLVVEELGAESYLIFPMDTPRLTGDAIRAATDARDDADGTLIADDDRAQFIARIDGRRRAAVGEPVRLALHTSGLHFFDPQSGATLGGAIADGPASGRPPLVASS